MDSVAARVSVCPRVSSIKNLHHAGVFEEAFSKQVHARLHDGCFPPELCNNEDFCKLLYHNIFY